MKNISNLLKLNHFCYIVPNIHEAIKFYVEILNYEVLFLTLNRNELELRLAWDSKDLCVNLAMLQMNGFMLELIEIVDKNKIPNNLKHHICFRVDNIDFVYKELLLKDIEFLFQPIVIRNKVKIAFFLGPGDNIHEILEVLKPL